MGSGRWMETRKKLNRKKIYLRPTNLVWNEVQRRETEEEKIPGRDQIPEVLTLAIRRHQIWELGRNGGKLRRTQEKDT